MKPAELKNELVEMGFTVDQIESVISKGCTDLDSAVNFLTEILESRFFYATPTQNPNSPSTNEEKMIEKTAKPKSDENDQKTIKTCPVENIENLAEEADSPIKPNSPADPKTENRDEEELLFFREDLFQENAKTPKKTPKTPKKTEKPKKNTEKNAEILKEKKILKILKIPKTQDEREENLEKTDKDPEKVGKGGKTATRETGNGFGLKEERPAFRNSPKSDESQRPLEEVVKHEFKNPGSLAKGENDTNSKSENHQEILGPKSKARGKSKSRNESPRENLTIEKSEIPGRPKRRDFYEYLKNCREAREIEKKPVGEIEGGIRENSRNFLEYCRKDEKNVEKPEKGDDRPLDVKRVFLESFERFNDSFFDGLLVCPVEKKAKTAPKVSEKKANSSRFQSVSALFPPKSGGFGRNTAENPCFRAKRLEFWPKELRGSVGAKRRRLEKVLGSRGFVRDAGKKAFGALREEYFRWAEEDRRDKAGVFNRARVSVRDLAKEETSKANRLVLMLNKLSVMTLLEEPRLADFFDRNSHCKFSYLAGCFSKVAKLNRKVFEDIKSHLLQSLTLSFRDISRELRVPDMTSVYDIQSLVAHFDIVFHFSSIFNNFCHFCLFLAISG